MGRFSRKGTTKIKFLDTIAASSYIPTRAELDAGLDITKPVAAVDGFTLENQSIETPDMESTFDAEIPGSDKAEASTLTFYEDLVSSTLEEDLAKDTEGFIVFLRKGDVPASNSMDVFPVRVASNSAAYTVDNEAAKFMVKFTITDEPVQGAPVPAAA